MRDLLRGSFLPLALLSFGALPAQAPDADHLRDNVFGRMPWHELGPVASGGRIVDIAVHPKRRQVFWVAAASGGLWKTENGGISWVPQFQREYSISIGDLAVAPSDGDVLYVGTGEANNQRSSYWGNGVYRSTDGGETWDYRGLDGTEHIGRIAIHPTDPDTAFVAALGALYRGSPERGLYRTRDGGLTWERVAYVDRDTGFVDVAYHSTDPEILYAASYQRRRRAWNFEEGGPGSRLWRSRDGGNTWQRLTEGLPDGDLGRIGLGVFAGDGDTVYATIENLEPARAAGERPGDGKGEAKADRRRPRRRTIGGEVYRTDDGGDTWRKTHDDRSIGGRPGYYYGQIRVDPSERETVYVLSVQAYRSTDGGATWTPKGRSGKDAFVSGLHVDHHALWIDPTDPRHGLLGNDGGLAQTWDGGKHWDHLPYLPILQCYTIAVDRRSPYRIYVGLQDNGTWGFPIHGETTAGILPEDATKVSGGDGFVTCIDPDDPNVVYTESQFGGIGRIDLRTGRRRGIRPPSEKGRGRLRFNWNTPILLSPHNAATLYVGSQYLHRSRDRGEHWTTISPDLTTDDDDKEKGDVPHCTLTTIAESPLAEGLLFVGTDDGKVWRSRDGGHRWDDLTDRFPHAVRGLWVSRVEAGAHDADTVFVSFTGYREDIRDPFVFRTDDGGETWLSIADDLPDEPVNVVRQHPRAANVLLIGTEMGVYVSVDDGATWFPLGSGLPRAPVHDLVIHPTEPHILIGTHGRGVFALDASALENLNPGELLHGLHLLPPSDGVLLPRPRDRGYRGARAWSAKNPFVAPTFRYLLGEEAEEPITLEVRDVTGKVLWTHDGEASAGYHEVVWATPRRRRFGGLSGLGRSRSTGPYPGEFAVTIRSGETSQTRRFEVLDRRPRGDALGDIPRAGQGSR